MIKSKFSWVETISYGVATALSFLLLQSAGLNILSDDKCIYQFVVFVLCITAISKLIKNAYVFLGALIVSIKSEH